MVKAVNGVHPVGFAKGAVRREQQVLNRVMNVALVSMRTTWGKRLVYRAYQEHLHKVPVVRSANSVHLDGSVTIQKALLARVAHLVDDRRTVPMSASFVRRVNMVPHATNVHGVNTVAAMIRMQLCATIAPRDGLKIKRGKLLVCVVVQDGSNPNSVGPLAQNATRACLYPIQKAFVATIVLVEGLQPIRVASHVPHVTLDESNCPGETILHRC